VGKQSLSNLTGLEIEEVIGQRPGSLSKGPETDEQATLLMKKESK
jgi:hypothetical protein